MRLIETIQERNNALAALLGVRIPLLNAPMAAAAGPALAAAVSNAGGLGVLGGGLMSPAEVESAVRETKSLTEKPFAVGLRVPAVNKDAAAQAEALSRTRAMAHALEDLAVELGLDEHYPWAKVPDEKDFAETIDVLLALEVPVVVVSFGGLREIYAEKLEARGVTVLGAATTLREAKVQRAAGAAGIIVQGVEAGGPRLNFEQADIASQVGLMSLIGPAARATGLPVVAAGGIAVGSQWAAALAAGASGVMAGTAFLRTEECAAPSVYKEQLAWATDAGTRLVRTFEGRLTRVVVNGLVEALEDAGVAAGDYPAQCAMMRPLIEAAARAERGDLLELSAGQSVAMTRAGSASDVVGHLCRELEACLGTTLF